MTEKFRTETRTVRIPICNLCGKDVTGVCNHQCDICGCLPCFRCRYLLHSDGDLLCTNCFAVAAPFDAELQAVSKERDEREDDIRRRWRAASEEKRDGNAKA